MTSNDKISCDLSAPFRGIFEAYSEPGEKVAAGDLSGQLYSTEEVERDDVLALT